METYFRLYANVDSFFSEITVRSQDISERQILFFRRCVVDTALWKIPILTKMGGLLLEIFKPPKMSGFRFGKFFIPLSYDNRRVSFTRT